MKRLSIHLAAGAVVLFTALPARGQQIDPSIFFGIINRNLPEYLSPLTQSLGIAVNNGLYNTGRPHRLLGFDVTLNLSVTMLPLDAQSYMFSLPDTIITMDLEYDVDGNGIDELFRPGFSLPQMFTGDLSFPTILGSYGDADSSLHVNTTYINTTIQGVVRDSLVAWGLPTSYIDNILADIDLDVADPDLNISKPPGLGDLIGISGLPMVFPQASIGLPLGLELTLRGSPTPLEITDSLGATMFSASVFGFGGRFDLKSILPKIPLVLPDLSVGFYQTYFNMTLGSEATEPSIAFKTTSLNAMISKKLLVLTVYAGAALENAQLRIDTPLMLEALTGVDYGTALDPFEDSSSYTRFTLGARVKLLLLAVHAQIAMIGDYKAYTAGLSITFR